MTASWQAPDSGDYTVTRYTRTIVLGAGTSGKSGATFEFTVNLDASNTGANGNQLTGAIQSAVTAVKALTSNGWTVDSDTPRFDASVVTSTAGD